jgi:hypothetical protein
VDNKFKGDRLELFLELVPWWRRSTRLTGPFLRCLNLGQETAASRTFAKTFDSSDECGRNSEP